MDFKKSFNRVVTNVVQFFANGLSQSATDRDAEEKEVTPGMPELLRRAAAEGAVLIENNGVLPLKEGTKVALFGITGYESHYVGYGSGGDVNKPYAVSFSRKAVRSASSFMANSSKCCEPSNSITSVASAL